MEYKRFGNIYKITNAVYLDICADKAWTFFSTPRNLDKITPKKMQLELLSDNLDNMYPGQIISYRVRPLVWMRSFWTSKITHIKEKEYFIDEQIQGPFSIWTHTHKITKKGVGTNLEDEVYLKIPLGVIGHLAFQLFIKNNIKNMFAHRNSICAELLK